MHTTGDRHFVELPDGSLAPITLLGRPGGIPEGWHPLFLYAGFAPIHLLELRHDNGDHSTWFLDRSFDRLAYDHPESLTKPDLTLLIQSAGEVLSRMWHQLLDGAEPAPDPDSSGFLRLGPLIRGRLARICEPAFAIRTTSLDLLQSRQRGVKAFHTASGVTMDIEVLWRMLKSDLLTQSLESLRAGRMDWESPAGGACLTTSGGVWLTDFLFAYRIVLSSRNMAFYLLVSGHPCQAIGILLPSDRVVFSAGRLCEEYTKDFHQVPVEVLLFRHLCHYGDIMTQSWRAGSNGFAAVFRERLISGQLWHDLTGLDLLVRTLPPASLPEIIGLWGKVPEIYGDTEAIFPETDGKIVRSLDNDHEMILHAYRQRRILVRTTSSFVTKALYTKLIDVSAGDPSVGRSSAVRDIRALGCPVVLLGLRVENRTVEDLPEFCAGIIDFLTSRCGPVAVVIDGHNSARGDTPDLAFASEFQQHAREAPIVAERRVMRALQKRYENSSVILIDNIGGSMAQSIYWCHGAHFFITMYGTGLAKYRWACNQTGLIVTSQWTLRNQSHLHIYEKEYLEEPAPLTFLPERFVEDLPHSPLLIEEPGNPPARWNFRVRTEGLFAAIDELLRRTWRKPEA